MDDGAEDPGVARAGAAVAARRAELGMSQREIARQKMITAPALIAFEKGRAWPRERTRHMLEELLQWPAGTIAAIRAGRAVPGTAAAEPAAPGDDDAPLIVGAVDVAMSTVAAAIMALPADEDPQFAHRIRAVLADVRQLEAITARAVRSSHGAPSVIRSLGTVRRLYDELMTRAAAASGATLGQRLYTARRTANLTAADAAAALGTTPDLVSAVESETPPPEDLRSRIEALLDELVGA